jgi:hypothetical protein
MKTERNRPCFVPFTPDHVQAYLDRLIRFWRRQRDAGVSYARFYIDAFQCVRTSLFRRHLAPEPCLRHSRARRSRQKTTRVDFHRKGGRG